MFAGAEIYGSGVQVSSYQAVKDVIRASTLPAAPCPVAQSLAIREEAVSICR